MRRLAGLRGLGPAQRRQARRRAALPALAGLLAVILAPTASDAADGIAGPVDADVIRVVDGDTLDVSARIWPGQTVRTRIRVAGIDTPEMNGPCQEERAAAAAAAEETRRFVEGPGGVVRLKDVRPGKYAGRMVATVLLTDGRDLADVLVTAGLARPYRGGTRVPWCP